jgi:photosystem II stability/assembly factor-like uncharacterized protein
MMKTLSVLFAVAVIAAMNPQELRGQWVSTAAPKSPIVYCLAVGANAAGGSNLFAGTNGNGILLSTDNGATWNPANTGLTSLTVRSIVFAGASVIAGAGNKVFLSSTYGASWVDASTGLPPRQVLALAVTSNAAGGTNIFAGVADNSIGGVFLSTNNGTSWTAVNNGLTNKIIYCLTTIGSTLFAGTYGGGVFRSTDAGANWTAVNSGLVYNVVFSLAASGANLFAGTMSRVYVSADNGANWATCKSGMNVGELVRCLATSPKATGGINVFAGSQGGGIYYSGDLGQNWSSVFTGFTDTDVYSFAVLGGTLFAASGGVWKRPIAEMTTSTEASSDEIPLVCNLKQNYPNPFNPATGIAFSVSAKVRASLKIYDMLGREVETLVEEVKSPGRYTVRWDAGKFASGVYFYRLIAGDFVQTRKLTLMK